MSNKTYDYLKWIAQVFIPAAATLYFAIAEIWQLPYKAEIIGTASAVDAFLGALLQISSNNWYANYLTTALSKQPEESAVSSIEDLPIEEEEKK